MQKLKERVKKAIDSHKEELTKLSHDIHSFSEVAFTEHRSSKSIADLLSSHGFHVQMGVGGLDTAFLATKEGRKPGPHLAFLAEYDSLPGIGHACGHNVIASCSVGAFLGAASVMDQLDGSLSVIGTPAEEAGGGKIILLEEGVFENVDFALMMHPSSGRSLVGRGGRAATSVTVTFKGRSAHSSAPGAGVNALSAVIATFNNIDMMRPTFRMQDNVNGIITHGGLAANVIPGEASCEFSLRAETLMDLRALAEKVKLAVESAARLTGAQPDIHVDRMYAERYSNRPMCAAFKDNMESLGEEMMWANPTGMYGSSDIGNVSIKIPAIHDYLWIAPRGVNSHNAEYTVHAASPRADEVVVKGAKGLAMTAIDVLSNLSFQEEIKEFHRNQVPQAYKDEA